MDKTVDLVVIGGGINGCGCAADAAMRGLSVVLCEKDDLASKTSSNSSKLIHGGLRYLEHFNFSLVKKALNERQRLLALAPHLIHPLPFVLPCYPGGRNRWWLAAGLFIYDHLSFKNKLPKHQALTRQRNTPYFQPLRALLNQGFLFYDCKTDDARLVIANALQAEAHGARIMTHTALIGATAINNQWQLTLQPKQGEAITLRARAVINACGPWVEPINQLFHISTQTQVTLLQGSHLVVPKLYDGEHAYMLQDEGNRIIFAIPYNNQTLIGTTETLFDGSPDNICIEPAEIDYLCTTINRYFNHTLSSADIISTSTGIRTLVSSSEKNPTTLSRDYAYQFSTQPAPAISIFSGKLTTYRELAESAINTLRPIFPHMLASSTRKIPLPGARLNHMNFKAYATYFHEKYSWLDIETTTRYLKTYGACAEKIMSGRLCLNDLGQIFGQTLYQAEVDYLIQHEWAKNSDDILWRRTKLGLVLHQDQIVALNHYLNQAVVRLTADEYH